MKKVLVPVDFSETSENALNFAIKMTGWLKAEIVLLHVIYLPTFVTDEIPPVIPPFPTLKEDAEDALKQLVQDIQEEDHRIPVSYACVSGTPGYEIMHYAQENKIDLIVAGIQGKGFLVERVMGSTASYLIQKGSVPVMVIDKRLSFKVPRKMVLATDLADIENPEIIEMLSNLTHLFKAHLYVLHVHDTEEPLEEMTSLRVRLERSFHPVPHTFCYSEDTDIVNAINTFVEQLNMDLVIMIPRKHSFFDRIFHESMTKKMAFHSKVPLLTFPE